jgi:thiol reductant ABC exporter CydC subunit
MAAAGYLISRAAERPSILSLTVAIVAVRFFGLARPLARYVERLASHDVALRSVGRARTAVYERLEPLAPGELETYRSGELLSRFVADVDALQGLHLRGVGPPLVAVVAGAASVGVAAAVLPAAALVLLAGLLLAGVAVPAVSRALVRSTADRQAALRGELTADLVELLAAAPELVVYGREDETLMRLRSRDKELVRVSRRDALAAGVGDAAVLVVSGCTVAGVIAVAVSAHVDGRLDRVLIALLALLALASFEAVQPIAAAVRDLSTTLGAGGRVLAVTDRKPEVSDPVTPAASPPPHPVVTLEGVVARYGHQAADAVSGLDLRLEPGRKVALLGPSGAGKTTVTNLLLRFLDPAAGRVTIGGRDVRDYAQDDVRRTFALAGQDAHLFNASIAANLAVARPGATEEELAVALRLAGIETWVSSLPHGLQTVVGERGTALSGGQRQRLVLARALLAERPVLLLDEPTAHLDERAAEALIRDVLDAAGDRSVLLITHRPEGLDLVDEVITMGVTA